MTTTTCTKCDGKGYVRGFEHIESGVCFRCMGTGHFMTGAEKVALLARRAEAADRRTAAQQGVSLEDYRAYVSGSVPCPKHANGCSFSLQEFAEWRKAGVV